MKLTVLAVFTATQILTQIINEKRALPLKGSYRVAVMHRKLQAEFQTIAEKRDAMILAYGHQVWVDERGNQTAAGAANARQVPGVPEDKAAEFAASWATLAAEEIEVDVQPIPLRQLDLGDDVEGSITALELIALGELVADDSPKAA